MHLNQAAFGSRILCIISAAYIIGIVLAAAFSPSLLIVAVITTALFTVVIIKAPKLFLAAVFAALSLFVGNFHFLHTENKNESFYKNYTGKYITISGTVSDVSAEEDGRLTLLMRSSSLDYVGKNTPLKNSFIIYTDDSGTFSPGQQITFRALVKKPAKYTPTSFNFNLYLLIKGVSASFYLSTEDITVLPGSMSLYQKITALSKRFSDKISAAIGGDEGSLAAGIALGDTSGFSDHMNDIFRKSGISHIVAVSGMNMTIIIAFLFFLTKRLKLHRKLRSIIAIFLLLFYMALTGFTPSVTRAGIMMLIVILAGLFDKKEDLLTSFFLSAAIILSFNPLTIFDAGFLLSYFALAGILVFARPISEKLKAFLPRLPKFLTDIVCTSIAASIATLPVTIYLFNGISTFSLITNILVLPFVDTLFILSLFTPLINMILPFWGFLMKLALKVLLLAAEFVASLPFSYIHVKTPSVFPAMSFVFAVIIFYLFLKNRKPAKLIWAAGCLCFLFTLFSAIASFLSFSVTYLYVGQGDSVLIQTPFFHNYLIDTGPNGKDTATQLKSMGVNDIDILFISHTDRDHSGGLSEILEEFPTKKVVFPSVSAADEDIIQMAEEISLSGTMVDFATNYYSYILGGAKADIVWPSRSPVTKDKTNNNSLVIRLDFGEHSFLFTGDIGTLAESLILNTSENVDVDILKVAHHGSSTSSSDIFLKNVSPDYSVISVGAENSYGHPSSQVLGRLDSSGSEILRTDALGNITFLIDCFGKMSLSFGGIK